MRSFWQGKRVLVTGHTGFKGGWLCVWLRMLGAQVYGFSLDPPTSPNFFSACGLENIVGDYRGDVTNLDQLMAAVNEIEPQIIFHLAAQSIVRLSYEEPVETLAVNIMGSVNILESARLSPVVKAVVMVTSDKCYKNNEWHWGYRETDAMGGRDPYSCSKSCAELVTASFRDSFFQPTVGGTRAVAIATARAGNVIGGGDWAADRLLPDITRALVAGQTLALRNPDAVRPWQHVLEPLYGYLVLAQGLYEDNKHYADSWNFGPNEDGCRPVWEVVELFTGMWDASLAWKYDSRNNPHEAKYLRLDISKAKAGLGWAPCWNLKTAIHNTVQWYKAWNTDQDMLGITQKQILSYEEDIVRVRSI